MVKYVKQKVRWIRAIPWNTKRRKEELERMEMNRKLDLILEQMNAGFSELRADMAEVKADVAILKVDVAELKEDVAILKVEVAELKEDVAILKVDVANLKEDVEILKTDMEKLKADVVYLQVGFADLKQEVDVLAADMVNLKTDVNNLKEEMTGVKLKMENQIWSGIRIIAEGHLDFNRKLDTYVAIAQEDRKYTSEVECLKIRMLELESNANLKQ